MAFDLNALFADPQFQSGLGMLGAASPAHKPLFTAYQILQNMKQQEMEQAKQKQEAEYRQAQIEVARANAARYGESIQLQRNQEQRAKENRALFQRLYPQSFQEQGQPPVVPQSNLAQPPSLPAPDLVQPPSDLFPKADMFVANIEGGYVANDAGKGPTNYGINQRANPDINVKTLTPENASEIRKQRYWDALSLDRQPPETAMVAYDAAINQGQQYALDLIDKTGGDPTLMLYQRRQDYRKLAKSNPMYAKSLKGWEERLDELQAQLKQGPATPALPPAVSPSQYGLPEVKLDAKGELEFTAKPNYEQQRIDIERQKLPMEERRVRATERQNEVNIQNLKQTITEKQQKLVAQRATDFGQVQGVMDSVKQLQGAAVALRNNPGLDHITGAYSMLPDAVRMTVDPQGMNAKADLDALGSKILLSTITALKALSQNGSTGFGQLSNVEGEHLVNSIASLKQAQTTSQIKERLTTVIKATNATMDRAVAVYEETHGASPYQGLPVGTHPFRDAKTGEQQLSKNGFPLLKLPNGKLVEERE